MGEENKPDPKPDPKPDDGLGDAGKRALQEERRARSEAEKALKDATDRLKALEDKDKSETQKAADERVAAEKRAEKAEAELLRITVGSTKGLTPAQARRLVGTTKEELEADADDLLKSFKPNDDAGDGGDKGGDKGDKKDPAGTGSRPTERLAGGSDPTGDVEESDPRKLAEQIPRR